MYDIENQILFYPQQIKTQNVDKYAQLYIVHTVESVLEDYLVFNF